MKVGVKTVVFSFVGEQYESTYQEPTVLYIQGDVVPLFKASAFLNWKYVATYCI